ncbi:MAG TPA: winged helix-turn-helix domain-containing protein [Terriglobales bacterium]|nr:winged helix-turn-helix domain-containing protein [Terriglobales bacterium]
MVDKSNANDEISGLKDEVAKLREEVKRISDAVPHAKSEDTDPATRRGFGETISDYVNDVVGSVMSGISSEIERSGFVDPTGAWFDRHIAKAQARSMSSAEAERAANLMSAMSSEHRLRILSELLYGGRYASEFETVLKDITPSTLSNHLKTLQEAGLIVQEGDRGRYLITLPGRIALRMATRLTRFFERKSS